MVDHPERMSAHSQAVDLQMRTRKERRFSSEEAGLPTVTQHTSFKLQRPLTTKEGASSTITHLLSYLGPHNPRPLPVTASDSVWILDNVAFRGSDGEWQAEYVAAVFAQHTSAKVVDAVKQIADKIGLADDAVAQATIEKRIQPFLQDIQPGRQVVALHGGNVQLTFSPGGRNGISSDVRSLPHAPPGMLVPTTAEVPSGANGLLQARTFFTDPEGWAVISGMAREGMTVASG